MGKIFEFRPMDFDTAYHIDLMTENGFTITDPVTDPTTDDLKKKAKTMYGPRSKMYGETYEDEDEAILRYRCLCGYYHNKAFKGEICPICGEPVKYMKQNPRMTGWISLGSYKIVNPLYYMKMVDILGKKTISGKQRIIIEDILNCKPKVDIDGHVTRAKPEEMDVAPSSEFQGIGLTEFRNNFIPIMEHFRNKTKSKEKQRRVDLLIRDRDRVFCSHIPVYTTLLRPEANGANSYHINRIDTMINPTVNIAQRLPYSKPIEIDNDLYSIQEKVVKMWDYNYDLITGKSGTIRGTLKGGPLNYTGRNEIIPDSSLREDEVDLGYVHCMTMFKDHIVAYYMKLHHCNLATAHRAWFRANNKYSPEFYKIMVELNKRDDWMVLINRNPTLNLYSMLRVHVRNIVPDFHFYGMKISLRILAGFNADFDGDVLNIIGLVNETVKLLFAKFDPRNNMIISFENGYINPLFSISKGCKSDLFSMMIL